MMERNPEAIADRKLDIGLQCSIMLLFREGEKSFSKKMVRVYRCRGWKTALSLTASLPQMYSGTEKLEGVQREATRPMKVVQRLTNTKTARNMMCVKHGCLGLRRGLMSR